jgi:tRNA (cytidine/uridine-2'-O-)-methyltransferase
LDSGGALEKAMKVVLYQPEIPQNTGNIVRTCAMTGTELLLVRPLGFSTSDRMLKRAGLDYWHRVSVTLTDDLMSFLESCKSRFFFFSSRATTRYTEVAYSDHDCLIFGSETAGLPEAFRQKWPELFCTIPTLSLHTPTPPTSLNNAMPSSWKTHKRSQDSGCLNLSNAVSIVLYEALRQREFHSLTSGAV